MGSQSILNPFACSYSYRPSRTYIINMIHRHRFLNLISVYLQQLKSSNTLLCEPGVLQSTIAEGLDYAQTSQDALSKIFFNRINACLFEQYTHSEGKICVRHHWDRRYRFHESEQIMVQNSLVQISLHILPTLWLCTLLPASSEKL